VNDGDEMMMVNGQLDRQKTKQNSRLLGVKEGNLWTISALFPLPSSTRTFGNMHCIRSI
jgi:hypothetical protein